MKKKILIVDDSSFTRSTLRRILKEAGYEVSEASSGLEALEIMPIIQPDLITLDLLMPEMKGDELIGHLRSLSDKCPLVVITADIQQITRREILKAGAAALINKPIPEVELLEVIEGLLSEKRN